MKIPAVERNAGMRNMFDGGNHKEPAITFGIAQSQVWGTVIEGEYPNKKSHFKGRYRYSL
jgi:hypothetical protein